MKLSKFRVKDFRSVVDTGWIECQNVTAFAGENEAGKTTMLMALLKLMDVKSMTEDPTSQRAVSNNLAKINLKNDIPIERYDEMISEIATTTFVYAEFSDLEDNIHAVLSDLGKNYTPVKKFVISKTYGGTYDSDILERFAERERPAVLDYLVSKIPSFMYYKEVTEIDSKIDLLELALRLNGDKAVKKLTAREIMMTNLLNCLDIWESNLIKSIVSVYDKLSIDNKKEVDFREIFEKIPQFRMRIAKGFGILNREFLKWWGKDDVTIGFEPYNKGIIIKVFDAHGNSFNLENRSTGFRRFFALFLSFSIAGKDDYANSILLFDEAGAALHPLTQRKLADFFNELGKSTQLIYNTHTSYMLNANHLNRVRVVYKDAGQHTVISDSLKINADRTNEMSLFPVQSALALYVAEKQMAGCLPIVVLNDWDEYYLALIKNVLTGKGKMNSVYTTLIFATGENGIDAAAEAFSADEDLPLILLPSDPESRRIKARLINGKYNKCPKKVLELSDFVKTAIEFEDLIPSNFIEIFSRLYLADLLGKEFKYNPDEKLLLQIEAYASRHKITLPANYRSEIAKRMKLNTMMYFRDVKIPFNYQNDWLRIWKTLLAM